MKLNNFHELLPPDDKALVMKSLHATVISISYAVAYCEKQANN